MRILVISQYFWPENFRINDLVAELVHRGHEVTVLTGLPNYPEGHVFPEFKSNPKRFDNFAGADIVRVRHLPRGRGGARLIANYISFAVSSSIAGVWKLRGKKVDAIFVFEPSPITVGVPAVVLKQFKRAPIAFWVLDLWPESVQAVGAVSSPIVLRLIDGLVRFIYANCDCILAQSKSFIAAISKQVQDVDRIVYFPSWAEESIGLDQAQPAPELEVRPDLFTIVFAGNIGVAQDFGAVLAAAELLRNEPVRWVIVGDGRNAAWVAQERELRGLTKQILLPGRYPLERMSSFYRHADALLVSLRDEPIFALTIPGKVQSYLASGVPVLAMLNGEGADVITSSQAGIAVPAGDAAALAQSVRRLQAMSPTDRKTMGSNGPRYLADNFNRNTLIGQLEKKLDDLSRMSSRTASRTQKA